MRIYTVHGITKGLSEVILTADKKRAKEISELKKLGNITVKTADKHPNLRVAVGGENEMLDYLEWYDKALDKWHSFFTTDPMLYKKNVLEIVRKQSTK